MSSFPSGASSNPSILFSMSGVDTVPEETKGTETEKEESDGLKILTSANFESFLSETEHVLVMFFAPCKYHEK